MLKAIAVPRAWTKAAMANVIKFDIPNNFRKPMKRARRCSAEKLSSLAHRQQSRLKVLIDAMHGTNTA